MAYVINPDEYEPIGTHWIALYVNEDVTYFYSFGVENILKEITKLLSNRNITTNIFRTQAYDLIICGYFYIGFFDFMLKSNLFSPSEYKKRQNNTKIFSISSKKVKMKKIYCIVCSIYRNFKKPKITYIFVKALSFFYYL